MKNKKAFVGSLLKFLGGMVLIAAIVLLSIKIYNQVPAFHTFVDNLLAALKLN